MKKLLLSLFVGFVGIISFCNAGNYTVFSQSFSEGCSDCSVSISDYNSDLVCIVNDDCSFYDFLYNFDRGSWAGNTSAIPSEHLFGGLGICSSDIIYFTVNYGCSYTVNYITVDIEDILSGNVDTNYCVGNGLCPNACEGGGEGDLEFSNLYINSILHPGRENIFIDIPDYIQWDYSVDTGNFNIYVGSGYDMDYMNSIIKINSYRPTSSDFTNIFVSGLTLIFPYIFVLLLIIFMWKLIKRVFK